MKHKFVTLTILVMMVFSLGAAPLSDPPVGGLQPGEAVVYEQEIPINVVFIGYEQHQVDLEAFMDWMPATYEPLVRYPQFYGVAAREMGLHFDFSYNALFTDKRFENRFFKYLKMVGIEDDPTTFQQDYNAQASNLLDVTGPVLYIDAPTVERYLTNNSRQLGIDRESYTIYFINWYNRPDFSFHIYTKTDSPDPDTGHNFGELRDSRKMIAWGGTHGRSWFYDLSAGPEAWTDNWYVDSPDLNGDGEEEYRMPPIWEYAAGGYRDPGMLSTDLAYVARFVAINLLFTTSPLYDPLVTGPGVGGDKVVHVEMMEDDPTASGLDWIQMDFVHERLSGFQPYYPWETALEDNDPIDPGAEMAFRIFTGLLAADDCWNAYGDPFAQLYCYFNANYDAYVPEYGPSDYVAPVFGFNSTDENLGFAFGLLGFADDNWIDGTQSYVFTFDSPTYRDLGYGFSTTTVHEVGHHIGLSHPHDGYDSEFGLDYGPGGSLYFAWSGDESATIMSYLDVDFSFGKFDQDNMYRFEMAGYLNWANELAGGILSHPEFGSVRHLYKKADLLSGMAQQAFARWDYLKAATYAYQAYLMLLRAAENLGMPDLDMAEAYQLLPDLSVPHEGDPIRYPDR